MNAVLRPTVPPPRPSFSFRSRTPFPNATLLALFLLVPVPSAMAQTPPPIASHVGTRDGEWLGTTSAIVGDLDEDGYADYLIGDPGASPGGISFAGSALLYSGRTGALLHRVDGLHAGEQRAWVAALGDVNRDRVPDYAVAAPAQPNAGYLQAGSIWVMSGADHARLYEVIGQQADAAFGAVMAGIGDADGDGCDDFAVGASKLQATTYPGAGVVYVLSGVDGSLIRQFDGQFTGQRFGFSVAGIEDLSGDGLPDVIIGAPALDNAVSHGSAQLYSPRTGLSLGGIVSDQDQDALGWSVTGLGDVDGDGKPEWIAAAPLRDQDGLTDNGVAWVFSGASGAPLYSVSGSANDDRWGLVTAGLGHMNADGVSDFAVGSPDAHDNLGTPLGSVVAYSGVDATPLLQIGPDRELPGEGDHLSGGGDVDGDGSDDMIVSASHFGYRTPEGRTYTQAGRADVYGYGSAAQRIGVDLLPESCPDIVSAGTDDALDLLVLGSAAFDVASLVLESVRLNGKPPFVSAPLLDEAAIGVGGPLPCACSSAGPDGHLDARLTFRYEDIAPTFSGAVPGSGYPLRVTGRRQDGTRVEGTVCLSIQSFALVLGPNPMRRAEGSILRFEVPAVGADVRITVHDVRGRRVRELARSRMGAGFHTVRWDGRDDRGTPVPGGIYFVRSAMGSREASRRIVVIP